MKLDDAGSAVRGAQTGGRVLVVTDIGVAPLYLERLTHSLEEAGLMAFSEVIPAGEKSKTWQTCLAILNKAADSGLSRADGIAALGGGMVGDIAGFAASVYLRGINVYQIPTTLLAAVDSSIGGKTAVDLPAGKNLAGAFHMPALIIRDSELLRSLPEDVMRDGFAEVIKYGMICDEELFAELEKKDLRDLDLQSIIDRCASLKESFVAADPRDEGVRQLLNFGHTIGHALEKISGFSLPHGAAVAKGMDLMTEISVREGWCDPSCGTRLRDLLTRSGFDLTITAAPGQILEAARSDKKIRGGTISLITPDRIGKCRIRPVPLDSLPALLDPDHR
jgi:3-dehydroquinate synthase